MDWNEFSDDSWMEGDDSDSENEGAVLEKPKEQLPQN